MPEENIDLYMLVTLDTLLIHCQNQDHLNRVHAMLEQGGFLALKVVDLTQESWFKVRNFGTNDVAKNTASTVIKWLKKTGWADLNKDFYVDGHWFRYYGLFCYECQCTIKS